MKKRILLSLALVAAVAVGAMGLVAFEAHVINVTAKIENALAVDTEHIDFGTVFPQEFIKENLTIALSSSFLAEDRVDDVNYVIKQKPKVRPSDQNPDGDPYAMIYPDPQNPNEGIVAHEYCLEEGPVDADDPNDPYYIHCYPILCPYLSKHKHIDDHTMLTDRCDSAYPYDCEVDAFHETSVIATGHLVQSVNDITDKWVIDLAVPCFDGQCDQTYDEWVWGINPDVVNPWDWTLPASLESQTFGCDLWIEVTGISANTGTCSDGLDNDQDGYIDYPEDPDCIDPYDNEDVPNDPPLT
ncbi:hypothetical protein KAI52_02550 [Candidatus Parcubacteria bacterium]|nr:hypothetical protein [Candidatus Parcubacteria bacterium]